LITLYPHQEKVIAATRKALTRHQAVLIQSPTGSGKTVLATYMVRGAHSKGKVTFFIVHRDELIRQTAPHFKRIGIEPSYIAAGYPYSPWEKTYICSVQTLRRRLDKVVKPDLVIIDECHHSPSPTYLAIHEHFRTAKQVGLSATPSRLDGRPLDMYQHMVYGPSVEWLIANGYLSDYHYYAPSTPDTKGLHTRGGDFVTKEVEELMDKPTITGDAIAHYQRLARGKRAIVFAASVKHSISIVQDAQANGIPAAHVDGDTDTTLRRDIFASFRRGDLLWVSNVGIATEGVDIPEIEVAILLRATQSMNLYFQMVGRALRRHEGKKHAIILDHAGNAQRLKVLPDSEMVWTLEGKVKPREASEGGEKPVNIRQCPKCMRVHAFAPVCPQCGHVYQAKERIPKQVDGDLGKVDKEAFKRAMRREQAKARTLDELVALGKKRGYKHPHAWAGFIWTARQARKGKRGI
jgi:superfamily II DNA or RNA helicase